MWSPGGGGLATYRARHYVRHRYSHTYIHMCDVIGHRSSVTTYDQMYVCI